MEQRIDEIEKHYIPVERFGNWSWGLFLTCALLSVFLPYLDKIENSVLQEVFNYAFVLCVIAYAFISHYNGLYLTPFAERMRRRQLLSNSFNVSLTHEKTQLYYNNLLPPSVIKLGANLLENSFFSKNICNEMVIGERLKMAIYFFIWTLAILNRSTDLSLLVSLTQFLFSGEILIKWIKFEIFRLRNEQVYEGLYQLFLNRESSEENTMRVSVLEAFAAYEVAKSYGVKLSTKAFNKLNDQLSSDWKTIKCGLQIDT